MKPDKTKEYWLNIYVEKMSKVKWEQGDKLATPEEKEREHVVSASSVSWIEIEGTVIVFVNKSTITKIYKIVEI